MKKPLRSNFEPGSPRESTRRAQWKALGLSDEEEKALVSFMQMLSDGFMQR